MSSTRSNEASFMCSNTLRLATIAAAVLLAQAVPASAQTPPAVYDPYTGQYVYPVPPPATPYVVTAGAPAPVYNAYTGSHTSAAVVGTATYNHYTNVDTHGAIPYNSYTGNAARDAN